MSQKIDPLHPTFQKLISLVTAGTDTNRSAVLVMYLVTAVRRYVSGDFCRKSQIFPTDVKKHPAKGFPIGNGVVTQKKLKMMRLLENRT